MDDEPADATAPPLLRLWSLGEGAVVEESAAGGLTVVSRWGEIDIEATGSGPAEMLRRMRFGPVTLDNAVTGIAHTQVRDLLDRMRGAVVHSLAPADGRRPLLSLEPATAESTLRLHRLPAGARVRLSRFAVLRPAGDRALWLAVPGAPFRALLQQPEACALVTALTRASSVPELVAAAGLDTAAVTDLLEFLVSGGVALLAAAGREFPEDTDPALQGWAPHELQFHAESRRRQDGVPGGTAAAVGGPPPPPQTATGRRWALHRPDRSEIVASDPSLDEVLEADHHCPAVSGAELATETLGSLLYRAARVRDARSPATPSADGGPAPTTQRPYLSTACLYELEIYVAVNRCAGLPPGVYHYDPDGHALELVDDTPDVLAAVLAAARAGAGTLQSPAATLTITARVQQLSGVLFGTSYATALRHCGILQGVLYLVGRALGVELHPVPSELVELTGRALRDRWPAEVEVGHCVVDLGTT